MSPRYDARHTRQVLFVADEYWLFEDRLTAAREHHYDLRWHLAPDAHGRVEAAADGAHVRVPGLALAIWGDPAVELSVEDGWYAPRYGVKEAAPVLSAVAAGAGEATLLTLMVPTGVSVPQPRLRVLAAGDGCGVVTVEGLGRGGSTVDRISWTAGGAASWERIGRAP